MTKFLSVARLLILASAIQLIAVVQSSATELTILYWGDRFGRDDAIAKSNSDTTTIGGAAQLAGFVNYYREQIPNTLLFVAGGELAGSIPAIETEGATPAKILAKMKPDVYGPGVFDFSYGSKILRKVLSKAKVNTVLGNVVSEDRELFPSDTIIHIEDLTIAITSLVSMRMPEIVPRNSVLDLTVADPIAKATGFSKARRETCDMLVVLSQLDWEVDSLLAVSVPTIDLIIEGHSRTPYTVARKIGKTLLVSSGPKGLNLGKLTLDISNDSRKISVIDDSLITVESGIVPADTVVKRSVRELEQRYTRSRGKKLATLLTNWNVNPTGESNFPQWLADAIRVTSPSAKMAIVNNLDFERGAERGDLYSRDIDEMIPFDSPLIAFQIKGFEIRRIVEGQLAGTLPFLTWSGLKVITENGKVSEIYVSGEGALNDDGEFAVVTNGLLWDRFKLSTGLDPEVRPIFIFPITQRELIFNTAKRLKNISTPLDNRFSDR